MHLPLTLALFLLSSAAAETERESARALLERVIENQEQNQERQREYMFVETVTTEYLAKDESVKRAESETFEVTPAPGGEYRRLVARNGHPLSLEEKRKEEKRKREEEEERKE